jgi:CRISPR-associated endonuclease Csn1
MRRRRDRLLKRKARMTQALIEHGFFPADESKRKALVTLNPYSLRSKGLDHPLQPAEFARALFHINQRRGFKSNRKTDKKDNDSGELKQAISKLRLALEQEGCRTVGEWLHKRDSSGGTVRARYRQTKITNDDGKNRIDKSYDLYIDRAMIEAEFDALWTKQAELNPALFNDNARDDLRHVLLFQRPLKPVRPGRCTLMPDQERAPLALPSTQRFRMYQELNNLRILQDGLKEVCLTLRQRDTLAVALEANSKRSFTQIKRLLGMSGSVKFNFEDPKRQELKGNTTSAILSKTDLFGAAWFGFDEHKQDAIVLQLVQEENETKLVRWLCDETGVDEARAEAIANAGLPEGYGSLCSQALERLLPELRRDVMTYDKAVLAAGFDHHSNISSAATGEILPTLPYYGIPLQRHVGFGTGQAEDPDEKRYGKIANPTVHIGLNQVRLVVNALISRYGHPSEVIVELARDLKQSKEQRDEETKRQADNQKRNARLREDVAGILNISVERVKQTDIQKMILWGELSDNVADRRCPYSGVQISAAMLMSAEVEIEHILPFSETLDDSLNNKTVSLRQANRIKGNRTPWQARGDFAAQGWSYSAMLERAEQMPKAKRYRFGEDGYARWLKDDAGFLARALNDTRHLSKVAREYLSLVCPQNTRVIPGRMTAMLRAKFGLNDVLSLQGEKNRNDHRHHAVDACVIAVTDQSLLQRFAKASARAREQGLNRLVDDTPLPWPTYREHVARAVGNIWVSHKPDHGHEGAMFDATIYSAGGKSKSAAKDRTVIPFTDMKAVDRHGSVNGSPKAYKGLLSNSNYCIEVFRNEIGDWDALVLRTFDAYQLVRSYPSVIQGVKRLRNPNFAANGKPLILRLMINDYVRATVDGALLVLQVLKINSSGSVTFVKPNETNISARYLKKLAAQKAARDGSPFDAGLLHDEFFQKALSAQSLRASKARQVTVSPIGELSDPGFRE